MMPESRDVTHFDPGHGPAQTVERLERIMRTLADDSGYQGSVETFVPGAGEVFGVRVPQLRDLAGELFKAFRKDSGQLLAIAHGCWERASREHRLIALFLLNRMRLTPEERLSLGEEFLPDVGDWEICDQLCSMLTGPALAGKPVFMDELEAWAGDDNFWIRRAAVVSTVSLRKSKLDPETLRGLNLRTLKLCDRLLDDSEPYIRKAVDWALREAIKRDYDLGREFLLAHADRKPVHPARATLKLAAKKLKAGDQERFLKLLG
jgi:3-methyladenine DNA glycosylase AlkD